MTLILSSVIDGRFMAVSDVLLSVEGARADVAADLPLHYPPLSITTPNHTVVGTAQKSILIGGRILLQWAGNRMFAHTVARDIQEALDAGLVPDIPAILLNPEIGADDHLDSSLIVSQIAPDGLVATFELRAQKADGGRTFYAGTGAYDFFEDVEAALTPEAIAAERSTDRWYARLALVLAEEFYFHDPLRSYAYGGWHEIVRDVPWGFAKAPYLVKFWTVGGEAISSGPVFTSWYVNGHLCILSATGGNGPDTVSKVTIVPAWNQPGIDRAAALAGFDQPYFQIHIVHQGGGSKMFFHTGLWPDGFGVRLVDGRSVVDSGPDLIAKLLAAESMTILSRRSDPDF